MAEELKHLLETIQKDGVAKAQARAEEILAEARHKARDIVREAEEKAKQADKDAQQRAHDHEERGKRALEQGARDVLIALGRSLEGLVDGLVKSGVDKAMTPDALKAIIVRLADQYGKSALAGGGATITMSAEDEKALQGFLRGELQAALRDGLEIRIGDGVGRGFRLSLRNENLYHDFTSEAVAEELSRFLRPELREIVRKAVEKQEGGR